MKILLVQTRYSYPKSAHFPLIVEMPLGLCYLAAVLRTRQQEVRILDCLAEGYSHKEIIDDKIVYGISDDEIVKRIKEYGPDLVGISALFTIQYENVEKLCSLIKKIDKKIYIVVGGMHATVCSKDILMDKNVDFVLQGEADYTLAELVEALEKKNDYTMIDGLGYKKGKQILINSKKKFIEDLDKLPFPARDLLNIEKYFQAGLAHGVVLKRKRNVNLITSRGCPGGCTFCTIHLLWGRKFRGRSSEAVISELKQLKEKFAVKHVQFEDDNLTFDIPRAKRIFKGMIREKLNLYWNTPNGVALWKMDKETLRLMKESGCYFIKFAVESGSQYVLSVLIKKPQNIKRIIPLINYARKIGMKAGSFFVVGFPGETKTEMQKSFDFPKKIPLDWVEYSIATPHFGTELRKTCEENKYLKAHDNENLFTGKAVIETPDFMADWIENKIKVENKDYQKFLLFHRPNILIRQGIEVLKRNPFFSLKYLIKVWSN